MINKVKNNIWLVILLCLSLISKLTYLDRTPTGITNDELHFVLNAKSVYYTFTDIAASGWNPLSFTTIPHETSSELPFIILAPIIGPLPTNLFTARLPMAIFGTLLTLVVYFLAKKLFNNKKIALLSALVSTLNPWAFYVYRTAFDPPVAIFFYLLGIYILISNKGYKSVLSMIPFLLAFYSYIGTKILFLPIIIGTLIFAKYKYNLKQRPFLLILFFSCLVFFNYSFTSLNSKEARLSELVTPFSKVITDQVILNRSQTIKTPITVLTNNKYTVYLKFIINKYLTNFSPDIFFLTGDHTYLVSLWQHGYFYYLDALFILLGVSYLFSRYTSVFYYLTYLIALSPIPEAIRADKIPAYAFHSSFQYPFIYIVIGIGIFYLTKIKIKPLRNIILSIVILIQIGELLNLADIYFLRYPIYQPEGFYFSQQVLSQYIWQDKDKADNIYVVSSEPEFAYRSYLFYQNLINKKTILGIQKQYQTSKNRRYFNFDNVTFSDNQSNFTLEKDSNDTFIMQKNLSQKSPVEPSLSINLLGTTNQIFTISNDQICQNTPTKKQLITLDNIKVTDLDTTQLCNLYIDQL